MATFQYIAIYYYLCLLEGTVIQPNPFFLESHPLLSQNLDTIIDAISVLPWGKQGSVVSWLTPPPADQRIETSPRAWMSTSMLRSGFVSPKWIRFTKKWIRFTKKWIRFTNQETTKW